MKKENATRAPLKPRSIPINPQDFQEVLSLSVPFALPAQTVYSSIGSLNVTSRKSPFSLYRADLASFTMGRYNPKDAEGFINLFALPVTVRPKAKAESGNS